MKETRVTVLAYSTYKEETGRTLPLMQSCHAMVAASSSSYLTTFYYRVNRKALGLAKDSYGNIGSFYLVFAYIEGEIRAGWLKLN